MNVGTGESSTPGLLGDPRFVELKELLIRLTGLAYYDDKDEMLADRIHERMKRVGVLECFPYLELIRGNAGPGSELDELVAELTVGETHFFRHREQFESLRATVLPDLLDRNRDRRRLRVWSAGCASGPEAYTLAILLRHEFGYRLNDWDVSIVGTDINRKSLAQAREGRFGAWALRSTSEEIQRSCFRQDGKTWVLRPEHREWLSFQYHNLVQHPSVALLDGLSAFDLILCRNVLIYFDGKVSQEVIRRFHRSLADGGWLVVGDVENRPELFRDFRRVRVDGTTLYQKADSKIDARDARPASEPNVDPTHGLTTPTAKPSAPPPIATLVSAPRKPDLAPPVVRAEPPPAVTHADVRRLADRGELEEAERCCERLIERDRLDPFAHFYLALVHEHMGRKRSAMESLRRAVYLDRGLVFAHYYLGIMREKEGNAAGARKSFENVLELLSGKDPGELIEGGDGLTAGELKELADTQRRALQSDA